LTRTRADRRSVIASLETLLVRERESALYRFSLGSECLRLKPSWVAIFHLKPALELDPGRPAAWELPGVALSEGGVVNETRSACRHRGDQRAAKEGIIFARPLARKPQS
jgi:hypothetical protein